jgi:ABC-type glycerol-3-phosphate transport system substrate-binding protein
MSGKLSRRDVLRWGLAGTGALLLGACAPKPAPATQPTAAPGATAAKPAAAPVKLEFWVNQPMARTQGLWDSLIKEFQETYPGITIESLVIPFADYEPKLLTGLAGGTVGDLLDVHPLHTANMALKGALMPLDDLMPTLGVPSSEFTGAWDYDVWRGKRWATPRSDNPSIIMYNRNMVKAAGLTEPVELWKQNKWTIQAFEEAVAKLSTGEGTTKVYGTSVLTGSIRGVCVWLWGKNADVWNQDETKTLVDTPAALEAWEFICGMPKKGYAPTAAETGIPGGEIAMIGQRRLAFYTTGAQFVLGGQAQHVPEDVMKEQQLVPYFTFWNGKREIRNATNSQGIYRQSKHVNQCWNWIQYSVSDACQSKVLANRWSSPMLNRSRRSQAWLGVLDPNLESPEIWDAALDNIRKFPHPPRLDEMDKLFRAAQDKIVLGQATAKESMGELVPKINTILQEVQEEIKQRGL